MRAMMMGLVIAATMGGCATVGGGWDTGKMKMGTDCKVEVPHKMGDE